MKRVVVIGNAAAGKTRLSRKLGELHHLPITHVDSIQYLPSLQLRPHQETKVILDKIIVQESWLIDGYGPLDSLETRFALADSIVCIDFPLWRHYWWLLKRQLQNITQPRTELPTGCNELSWPHTKKMLSNIWKAHQQMRPELLRILNRDNLKQKTIMICTLKQWDHYYKKGL